MSRRFVLVLTEDQTHDLSRIFDSAERGREDFNYLAGQDNDDYDEEDVAEVQSWHRREITTTNALAEMLRTQHPWTEKDAEDLVHLRTCTTSPDEESQAWLRRRIDLQVAWSEGRIDLGDTENVLELSEALGAVEGAAEGDSNDNELSAYRDALDLALGRWPDIKG